MYKMNRNICAICHSNLNSIFCLPNMPIKLACVNKTHFDSFNLSFSQCYKCKTIQLDKLIQLEILYSDSHNYTSVGKVWDGYFKLFCSKIKLIVTDKNVLEVGDPSGKIANRLNCYNKWLIVEPNKNVNVYFNPKIKFIEGFFNNEFKTDEKIDVIIHSHLFEHIYEPNEFLKNCYNILNNGGEMFFGVPNMEHIAKENLSPFLGVFFEHTIFLNKQNIIYLLGINGFSLIEIIDYESHSTLYHVQKNKIQYNNVIITNYYDSFFDTLHTYRRFIDDVNDKIENTNLPVYIFGASYNTQFLLALGLNQTKINGILDNCIEKQDKFLFGYNLKIFSPVLLENNNSIIILKNGYYVNEISEQLLNINSNSIILF